MTENKIETTTLSKIDEILNEEDKTIERIMKNIKRIKVWLIFALVTTCLAFLMLTLILIMSACNKPTMIDYLDDVSFEAALNNGEDLVGKTVKIRCREINPSSAFGYDIYAGEHLNFCSAENPGVHEGDTIVVKITNVYSLLGSWIISYEIQE